MKNKLLAAGTAALGLSLAASTSVAQGQARPTQPGQAQQRQHQVQPPGQAQQQQRQARQVIRNWKPGAQKAAQKMIEKYGEPDEVTHQRVVWHDNGPWKRTEVINEEIPHNFPMPHKDMLYQTIKYETPVEKADDLLEMTGSLIIDRVKGELTARCDAEEANFLSINLAHQIVQGEITPEEGRRKYAQAMKEDQHAELKQELVFTPPQQPQRGDPGVQFGGREDRKEQQQQ